MKMANRGTAHGCYGIGVSRVVAAAIEQNNDAQGIIWPDSIAPFHIALVPMNQTQITSRAGAFRSTLRRADGAYYDVMYDDRKERPGVKFADMELIGIPHRIVIGDRGLIPTALNTRIAAKLTRLTSTLMS